MSSQPLSAPEARPVVYLCHPYAADPSGNVARLRELCLQAWAAGVLPLAPPLVLPAFVDEATDRDAAIAACIDLMTRCDEVWVYAARGLSPGMRAELRAAWDRGMTVRFARDGGLPNDTDLAHTGDPPCVAS